MPTPGHIEQPANRTMFDALNRLEQPPAGSVADELAALREEIAALRALLTPISAVILTGAVVRQQYLQLVCTCGTSAGPDYCMKHTP